MKNARSTLFYVDDPNGHLLVCSIEDKMNHVEVNGNPIGRGETVSVDHVVATYTVTVRSLSGVDKNDLKNLIQTKYEVTDIDLVDDTYFVRSSQVKDFPNKADLANLADQVVSLNQSKVASLIDSILKKTMPEMGDSVHIERKNKTGVVVAIFPEKCKFIVRTITGYDDVYLNEEFKIIPDIQ